jgi:hypothetical protein
MASFRLRAWHLIPLALLAVAATLPAGCGGNEGVTKYDVPKEEVKTGEPAAGEYRMLGAMFPADDPQWFFKYSDTAAEVAKNEAGFDEMLKSVKLNGASAPDFTAPKGWAREKGREGFVKVHAVVKPPEGKGEVTLTESRGGVEANLSRWVGQVGLKPGAQDVAKYTKAITTASGAKGLRVDLKGPNNPATKRGGPMMPPGHP